jgi:hypothetical protein
MKMWNVTLFFLLSFLQISCTLSANISELSSSVKSGDVLPSPSAPISEPDSSTTTPVILKLSGNSSSAVDIASRIFDENSGGWLLEGSCESDNGLVLISGDIDTTTSVECINDHFVKTINYSATTPYFNAKVGLSRKIIVSQSTTSEEVILYKSSSTNPPPVIIRTVSDFNLIYANPSGNYILANDIDASNGGVNLVNNFSPIDFSGLDAFVGTFEGDNHTISNLNKTTGTWDACLIAWVGGGAVFRNFKLTNVSFSTGVYGAASTNIAAVACRVVSSFGTSEVLFENIYVQGQIVSNDVDTIVGGVVAQSSIATKIKDIKTDLTISGTGAMAGGIIGGGSQTEVVNTFSKATINMTTKPSFGSGGIFGRMGTGADISKIRNSYFLGNISGAENVGGFVGVIGANSQYIENSYAISNIIVSATKKGGPIIGFENTYTYSIISTYFLDTSSCTLCTNSYGAAKTSTQLKSQATYLSWDFIKTWRISEGLEYPTLR